MFTWPWVENNTNMNIQKKKEKKTNNWNHFNISCLFADFWTNKVLMLCQLSIIHRWNDYSMLTRNLKIDITYLKRQKNAFQKIIFFKLINQFQTWFGHLAKNIRILSYWNDKFVRYVFICLWFRKQIDVSVISLHFFIIQHEHQEK